jgi:hypothetical protein
MPRFIAVTPIYNVAFGKARTGQTFADSAINAIGTDIVWPQVINSPSPMALRPLDASAAALMPGTPLWTGGNLIGIGLGAGLDAGI